MVSYRILISKKENLDNFLTGDKVFLGLNSKSNFSRENTYEGVAISKIKDYVPMMTRYSLRTKNLVFYILFTYSTLLIIIPRTFLLNKRRNE